MINSGREWDWMDKKTKMMSKEIKITIEEVLDWCRECHRDGR